ncbi:lipase family protein [Corynebacterium oculi]|uniref:Putative inactive lipase n=1 Tax=Corynebacterium oculi TaxID=1544416 RepID=A0A0Q0Z307_9CORY|nr:lipase family protein [Corynebacterium oculi]KQB83644.1 putative inactive lipase [Corynebacterium oculi]
MDISFVKKIVSFLLTAALVLPSLPAYAATPIFDPHDPFYLPPAELPAAGEIIRAAPAPDLQPPGWPATTRRILYSSTLITEQPAAVSGTLLEPTLPWTGPGPRPTLVIAPGTRGAGDACAPSRGLFSINAQTAALGINYELPIAHLGLLAGVRVVMTDYVGLGTPGAHTYAHNREEGRAVLDAARAALRATGSPAEAPVGLWGYSQGGGATAAAAELASAYAPELHIAGTFAGAPPANLPVVINSIEGNSIFGVLGMAVAGFAERNPSIFREEIAPLLNEEGRRYFAHTPEMCIPDAMAAWGGRRSRELTTTGESFFEVAARSPILWQALTAQNLGQAAPTGPVLIRSGINDDTIPHSQVRDLAATYCAAGVPVSFSTDPLPTTLPGSTLNHALPLFQGIEPSLAYLLERFRGAPAPNDCRDLLPPG